MGETEHASRHCTGCPSAKRGGSRIPQKLYVAHSVDFSHVPVSVQSVLHVCNVFCRRDVLHMLMIATAFSKNMGFAKILEIPRKNDTEIHQETNTKLNKSNKTEEIQTTLTLNTQASRTNDHKIKMKIAFVRDIKFFAKRRTA